MSIANISNGESGSSVRGKLNSVIDEVSPIEAAAEGSVFQKGATVNEALSREDFGKQIELFSNSPAEQEKNILFWDNFPNTGDIATTGNGLSWTNLTGTGATRSTFRGVNLKTDDTISAVDVGALLSDLTGGEAVEVSGYVSSGAGPGNRAGFVLAKDADNYIFCVFERRDTLRIYQVVGGGALTQIAVKLFNGSVDGWNDDSLGSLALVYNKISVSFFPSQISSNPFILFKNETMGISLGYSMPFASSPIVAGGDLTYIGITGSGGIGGTIANIKAKYLSTRL